MTKNKYKCNLCKKTIKKNPALYGCKTYCSDCFNKIKEYGSLDNLKKERKEKIKKIKEFYKNQKKVKKEMGW